MYLLSNNTETNAFDTRVIPKYSRGRNTYRFTSYKNQSICYCESFLEFCYLYWLEFLPHVSRYYVQPAKFYFIFKKKLRYYTPDILIYTTSGELIADDAKHSFFANNPKNIELYSFIRASFNQRGIGFKITTEDVIQKQPALNNLMKIYRKSLFALNQREVDFVLNRLQMRDHTYSELKIICRENEVNPASVENLMYRSAIDWPIDTPIQANMNLKVV
jgi:hypothetical protein